MSWAHHFLTRPQWAQSTLLQSVRPWGDASPNPASPGTILVAVRIGSAIELMPDTDHGHLSAILKRCALVVGRRYVEGGVAIEETPRAQFESAGLDGHHWPVLGPWDV